MQISTAKWLGIDPPRKIGRRAILKEGDCVYAVHDTKPGSYDKNVGMVKDPECGKKVCVLLFVAFLLLFSLFVAYLLLVLMAGAMRVSGRTRNRRGI